MGKQTVVTCDCCGVDVYSKKYYVLAIQTINRGVQKKNPSIYLCPKCFRDTKLALLLLGCEDVTVCADSTPSE